MRTHPVVALKKISCFLVDIVGLFTAGIKAILGIIIPVIILWYLFQPQVKAYFGVA